MHVMVKQVQMHRRSQKEAWGLAPNGSGKIHNRFSCVTGPNNVHEVLSLVFCECVCD